MTPVDFRWGPFFSREPAERSASRRAPRPETITLSASDVVGMRATSTRISISKPSIQAQPAVGVRIGMADRHDYPQQRKLLKVIDPTGVASGTGAAGSFVPRRILSVRRATATAPPRTAAITFTQALAS